MLALCGLFRDNRGFFLQFPGFRMSDLRNRMPLIDAFKAVASQLIVLHHLAFYGPMSDWTHTFAPGLIGWLSQDGRMAVQVFLVISGYLAVRSLAPHGVFTGRNPWGLLRHRYLTIVVPYAVALVVAIACAWVARQWMTHHSVPDAPQLLQFVQHVLLLNGVLDADSLSAGVWYVAIDFQLFALMLGLLWLGQRLTQQAPPAVAASATQPLCVWPTLLLVLGLGLASLWHFNLDADYDNWAVYFFGAYASGAVAYWVGNLPAGKMQSGLITLGICLALVALAVDFRTRIALALAVAVVLSLAQARGWLYTWPRSRVLGYLGKISYGVFLMNFPVSLVVNAAVSRFGHADVVTQTAGVVLAWLGCVAAGAAFYHAVEVPLRRWSSGRVATHAGRGWRLPFATVLLHRK